MAMTSFYLLLYSLWENKKMENASPPDGRSGDGIYKQGLFLPSRKRFFNVRIA